jgi:hypothetical protein
MRAESRPTLQRGSATPTTGFKQVSELDDLLFELGGRLIVGRGPTSAQREIDCLDVAMPVMCIASRIKPSEGSTPTLIRIDVNDESLAASAEADPGLRDESRARLQELCERSALTHVVPSAEAVPIVEEEDRTLLQKVSEELEYREARAVEIAVDQGNRDGRRA